MFDDAAPNSLVDPADGREPDSAGLVIHAAVEKLRPRSSPEMLATLIDFMIRAIKEYGVELRPCDGEEPHVRLHVSGIRAALCYVNASGRLSHRLYFDDLRPEQQARCEPLKVREAGNDGRAVRSNLGTDVGMDLALDLLGMSIAKAAEPRDGSAPNEVTGGRRSLRLESARGTSFGK